MKTILAASVIALMATSAMARGMGPPSYTPPAPKSVDMEQVFEGIQAALNKIEGGEDVNDVTQTALNAANLINLPDDELDVVTQDAIGAQLAANYVNFTEDLSDVTQSATNVLNSLTVDGMPGGSITQTTTAGQAALNAVEGIGSYGWKHGKGGYGSDDIYDVTQTALNAANLVSLGGVGDDLNIVQTFTTGQLAANYVGALDNVSKITQSATNVANSIGAIASGE